MSDDDTDLLILGLGNVLYGDDGLGVAAVHLVEQLYDIPARVRIADGGTLGLYLLPLLQQARQVLIVDAVSCPDAAPGEFVRLMREEVVAAVGSRLSVHQIGVADLLAGANFVAAAPGDIVLLGLVPESLEFRVALSATVEHQMPRLVASVIAEAERLGHRLSPKPAAPAADQPGRDSVATAMLRHGVRPS